MKTEFIPYEQALALKELGFSDPCFGYYYTLNGKDWKFAEKSEYHRLDDEINIGGKFSLLAPTFAQAFRFFREKYGYLVSPFQNENNLFFFEIGKLNTLKTEHYSKDWETYEDAEISCLVKLIEIVKK